MDPSGAFVCGLFSGFRVQDFGFGVWGLGFGVWGVVFGVWCLVFGVWCLVFGVWCLVFGVWVWGMGYWITLTNKYVRRFVLEFRIWDLGFRGLRGPGLGVGVQVEGGLLVREPAVQRLVLGFEAQHETGDPTAQTPNPKPHPTPEMLDLLAASGLSVQGSGFSTLKPFRVQGCCAFTT